MYMEKNMEKEKFIIKMDNCVMMENSKKDFLQKEYYIINFIKMGLMSKLLIIEILME